MAGASDLSEHTHTHTRTVISGAATREQNESTLSSIHRSKAEEWSQISVAELQTNGRQTAATELNMKLYTQIRSLNRPFQEEIAGRGQMAGDLEATGEEEEAAVAAAAAAGKASWPAKGAHWATRSVSTPSSQYQGEKEREKADAKGLVKGQRHKKRKRDGQQQQQQQPDGLYCLYDTIKGKPSPVERTRSTG